MFAWPDIDMGELYRYRWDRVAGLMAEMGLDHLVLTGADHLRYVTSFRAQLTNEPDWFAAVVDGSGTVDVYVPYVDATVESPFPDLPHVKAVHPLPSWAPAVSHPRMWVEQVSRPLAADGARVVGHDSIDAALLNGLSEALPETTLQPVAAELFAIRRSKGPTELHLLEAASRVNSDAMLAGLDVAAEGRTDHDVLAAAMHHQQSAGAEFVTHSVCNVRKSSGDWYAEGNRLRQGEPFFFDIGCHGRGGYASDAARTGFVGEPSSDLLTAYEHLSAAHELAQETARPGVKVSAIQSVVNEYLERHGYRGTPYGIGHGVGLRICELPTIGAAMMVDEDVALENGEVISLEPELTVDVQGRSFILKIEDDFVVEANGIRALTVPVSLDDVIVGG